ncbi:Hsp20/alpha crystallin family protein [Pleionea sp. CnH1-48]|uniref:Hsp20/alpha crystallin family protein n=1 Tax=Pleionea sp. CnH1-48 TaxID=2954494 RepID=UPI00209717DF|nr:Hsp20/alpha crystallin family protein [Pleionea sp. CnH1-48]MCO7224755.1 Hsp20/alpha crystallin family protein [Pleionea sp. CnH1-48]
MTTETNIKGLKLFSGIASIVCLILAYHSWALQQKVNQLELELQAALQPQIDSDWDILSGLSANTKSQLAVVHQQVELLMKQFSAVGMGGGSGGGNLFVEPSIEQEDLPELYIIRVSVPEEQDVEVQTEFSDGMLTISGKVIHLPHQHNTSNGSSQTEFTRSMSFSEPVDHFRMTIEHEVDGVSIILPKK